MRPNDFALLAACGWDSLRFSLSVIRFQLARVAESGYDRSLVVCLILLHWSLLCYIVVILIANHMDLNSFHVDPLHDFGKEEERVSNMINMLRLACPGEVIIPKSVYRGPTTRSPDPVSLDMFKYVGLCFYLSHDAHGHYDP